jgi:Tfp pilus assembly protein PilF
MTHAVERPEVPRLAHDHAQDLDGVAAPMLQAAKEHREAAMSSLRRGDTNAALVSLARALGHNPADTDALWLLAEIAELHQRDTLRAKACYCAVLAIDPSNWRADNKLREWYRAHE